MRFSLLVLFWAAYHISVTAQPLISAHRGSSLVAPENTLATFRAVLTMPISYIEIDVRTTKDGQLIILHDGKLDRTTSGSGPVESQSLAELKQLSAGKGFGDEFKNERIPTLREVCQLLRDWNKSQLRKVNLYVDCKAVDPKALVKELASYGLLNNAVFHGSDDFLFALRQVSPKAKLMPSLKSAKEISGKIQKLQPYAFDVRWQSLTTELVQQIHAMGIQVFADALGFFDNSDQYKKAAEMGVDVIQTDRALDVSRTLEALK